MYEIVASFDNGKNKEFTTTEAQWRYNSGQKLQFIGVNLPGTYEVHFSNSLTGTSVRQIGDSTGVLIPSSVFIPGSKIYAWIYVTQDNVSVTKYQVTIPIRSRAEIATVEPTPEELDIIEQAIQELNSAVDTVQDISDGIEQQINDALQQAKDSGEFDGADGRDGIDGKDGKDGKDGVDGKDGQDGAPGVGVPADGTPGQVLYKGIGDYNTHWGNLPASPPPVFYLEGSIGQQNIVFFTVTGLDLKTAYDEKKIIIARAHENGELLASMLLQELWTEIDGNETIVSARFSELTGDMTASFMYVSGAENELLTGNFSFVYINLVPDGGTTGQVLAKASNDDGNIEWIDTYSKPSEGIPSTDLSQAVQTALDNANSAYQKPSSGIPASDLESGVIPTVPTPATTAPEDLGTAAAGTSTAYARADHVHKKPTATEIGALPSSTPIHNVPSGGSAGQVLSKASGTDYDTSWVTPDKGVYIIPATLNTSTMEFSTQVTPTQLKQAVSDGKLPILSLTFGAALLRLFLVNTLDYTEDELYTRGVFCFNDDSGNIYSAFFEDIGQDAYIVGDVFQQQTILSPSNPSVGDFLAYTSNGWSAKILVPEVTISTAGDVTQSLDAGKIYHFTGSLSSLTLTLNAAPSGQLAQYHFDFLSGSTAPTLTLPNTIQMPDSFSVEASKRYEVDVLNNYGMVVTWANS